MKIGLLSFADCNNYGDQYFAPICRAELAVYLPQAEFNLITPTGTSVEGDAYIAYEPARIEGNYTALLVVGGEVVHTEDNLYLDIYARQGLKSHLDHPTDLVFGSALLDAPYKAWVATGLSSHTISPWCANRIGQTLPRLNRVLLRGVLARDSLDALVGRNLSTEVVPDLGWLIPAYSKAASIDWPELAGRVGIDPARPYLVFHTFPGLVKDPAELTHIITTLRQIQAETGLQIVLLPITHYNDDRKLLNQLNLQAGNSFSLVPKGLTRDEIAHVLLHTTISVTSSLHGTITALAAGIPAGAIHRGETKFSDVFGAQQRLNFLRRDWSDLHGLIMDLLQEPRPPLLAYAEVQRQRLAIMFGQIAEDIKQAASGQAHYPFRGQLASENNNFRRDEWLHVTNLNQLLQEELTTKIRQLNSKTSELNELKAGIRKETDFLVKNLDETDSMWLLQGQLAETRAANRQLSSQLASLRAEFKALQNTRTVRLTRNFSLVSKIMRQLTGTFYNGKIQGALDQLTLESNQLIVKGWAVAAGGDIRSVEVYLDDVHLGPALLGLERPDVLADRPFQLERFCGYAGQFELATAQLKPGTKTARVTVTGSKGPSSRFTRQITF